MFHEAETFKLIDTLLGLCSEDEFVCVRTSSILFDMIIDKLKLNF